jgi:DNA repair exonuclease SbcCD ATPase subunit
MMEINELELKDFMIHKESTIGLGDLTLISGDNGSGKSSALKGIGFATTGNTRDIRNRDIKVKDIIRKGNSEATAIVKGQLNGKPMTLMRSRTQKGLTSRMVLDGREITEPSIYINRLMTENEYDRLVYIDGHLLSVLFSSMTPAALSEMLDKLFGVEDINDLVGEIKPSIVNKVIELIKQRIATIQEALEIAQRSDQLQKQMQELVEKKNELVEEIPTLETQLDDQKEIFRDIKDKEEAWKTHAKKKQKLQTEIETISGILRRKELQMESLTGEVRSLKESLDRRLPENYTTIDDYIANFMNEIAEMEQKINDTTSRIANEQAVPTAIDILINKVQSIDSEESEVQCPVCGYNHSSGDLSVASLETLKGSSRELQEILKSEIEELKSKRNLGKRQYDEIKDAHNTHGRKKEQLDTLDDEIKDYKEKQEATETAIEILDGDNPEEYDEARLEEVSNRIAELSTELRYKRERVEEIEARIRVPIEESDNASAEDLRKSKAKLEALKDFREKIVRIRNGFSRILKSIRESIISKLNEGVQSFLDILSPKDNGENLYIKSIYISLNRKKIKNKEYYQYGVEIDTENGKEELENLSTGQKTLVMLPIIFALNDIQNLGVNFILFDEPDETVDAKVQEKLATILTKLATLKKVVITTRNNNFKQMIADKVRENGIDDFRAYDCSLQDDPNGDGKISVVEDITAQF